MEPPTWDELTRLPSMSRSRATCLTGGLMVVVGLNYYLAEPALPTGNAIIGLVIFIYAALAALQRTPGRRP